MKSGRLRSTFASLLAFGRLAGLVHPYRRSKPRVEAKPVTIDEPTMTAENICLTFQSNPELYRAIHPIFGARQPKERGPDGVT
jgi:hypothetical protein